MRPASRSITGVIWSPLASPILDKNERQSFDRGHWKEVTLAVQHRFRFARLKVFKEINRSIYELICSSETSPKLDAVLQMTYRLVDAAAQDDLDVEILEKDFTDFVVKFLNQLGKLPDSDLNTTNPHARYGGAMGNTIFRTMAVNVVIPMFTLFFAEFLYQTSNLDYQDKLAATIEFLHAFLVVAGNERGRIAKMTATYCFEEFGRLLDPLDRAPISDFVPGWEPWETMMIDKICEVVASRAVDAKLQDFFDAGKRFTCELGNVRLFKWSDGTRNGFFGGPFDEDCDVGTRFWFTWSPQQKNKDNATTSPMKISELECRHPQRGSRVAEEVLAPAVLEALCWKPGSMQPLECMLASILHDLSHTSTFARGTASISEMMIKAIAAYHGYVLEFSPDWTPPNNPQPDQHALSEPDREIFIQETLKHGNIILYPSV